VFRTMKLHILEHNFDLPLYIPPIAHALQQTM
jgi:hypothetical protein